MSNMTLGSLFDGSGGFPLGGMLAGITPVWASEIEPFPIRVTTKRLPFMKHYGNVSEMDGGKVEPVDIITFGSPCQDMSVAGKRAGLDGSRSNLFYEAVRIIKEMRKATGNEYPKWACWENVPGAFSSSGGEDFRCVLESLCGIVDESVSIPKPEKWAKAGEILGDGYSVAWRTLDAQYWGVPQRRKRIFLVADFTGGCAGKVLFESEGLSGYSPQGFRPRQTAPGGSPDRAGAAGGIVLNDRGGSRMDVTNDVTSTLRAAEEHLPCVLEEAAAIENHPMDGRVKLEENGKVQTLSERMGTGGNNVPLVLNPCSWDGGQISPTLTKQNAGGSQRMPDKDNFNCVLQPVTGPLLASGYDKLGTQEAANGMYVLQPFGISSKDSNAMKSANPHSGVYEADTSRTLDGNGGNPSCNQGGIAVVCVDMGGGKSGCGVSMDSSPTLSCTHGGEPAICIQGSVIGRKDENGPQGDGINEDVAFTLNATDRHAVYSMTTGGFPDICTDRSPTLMARDFKDPAIVAEPSFGIGRDAFNQGANAKYKPAIEEELQPTIVAKGPGAVAHAEHGYSVRRLTPTECARLQGFPDFWCSALDTSKPTDEEVYFWYKVFRTYAQISGGKIKTDKQIRKWLKDPYSDAAEYKMWGNGVALPCVFFVLSGIVFYSGRLNRS